MEPSITLGVLWFIPIAYMFFAQHLTCDAYFVPAINVFCEKMRGSKNKWLRRWGEEAVAGATICALGCNGPELFSNLISLFTGSDAGIGVVVGSEIFNLLIIIGASILASPVIPLQIDKVPFTRDVLFYAFSIGLLYWTLLDKTITWDEALTLLGAAAFYVIAVYFTTDIAILLGLQQAEDAPEGSGAAAGSVTPAVSPTATPSPSKRKGVMHGVEVEVEEILHGRMVDGRSTGHHEPWKFEATEHGIYASESLGGRRKSSAEDDTGMGRRMSVGFEFAEPDSMLGPVLKYKDLKEVVLMEMGVIQLEFFHNFAHITLKIHVPGGRRDELLGNIQEFSLGRPWVHGYDSSIKGAVVLLIHVMGSKDYSFFWKLWAIPHFGIDGILRLTLSSVDVKDVKKEGRWGLCFLGSMIWLALFSWAMLLVADQIHYNIPAIPNSFLGITVCAIGTSFPNAVASVIMSQQNKPAAAIANALGSNVQNVFLAMALPWCIYSYYTGFQPIVQDVAGITEGVFWMMGTLLLLVVFVLMPGVWELTKCNGWVFIVVYLLYLLVFSGETFGWWPPLIN